MTTETYVSVCICNVSVCICNGHPMFLNYAKIPHVYQTMFQEMAHISNVHTTQMLQEMMSVSDCQENPTWKDSKTISPDFNDLGRSEGIFFSDFTET